MTPEELRTLREALGMTARQFAVFLGLCPSTGPYARWESGEESPFLGAKYGRTTDVICALEAVRRRLGDARMATIPWLYDGAGPFLRDLFALAYPPREGGDPDLEARLGRNRVALDKWRSQHPVQEPIEVFAVLGCVGASRL